MFFEGSTDAKHSIERYGDSSIGSDDKGTPHDREDMSRMGKTQELARLWKMKTILAFTATLMCTWEALLISASYILPNGGLAGMIWTYVASLVGFGAATLSMAEMASRQPTSGGQYHWASIFAPRKCEKPVSYVVGWLCVLGWQAGVAGQSFSAASQLQGIIILNYPQYVPEPFHGTLLKIAIAGIAIVFNTVLAKRLPLIDFLVFFLHVLGFGAVLIPLWVFAPINSSTEVWTKFTHENNWPSIGVACLVGLASPVISLIGPDSAVHMAEEIKDASLTLPKSMVWTLVVNGSTGLIMIISFAYCLGPLQDAINPQYNFAYIGTFYNATQSVGGTTAMSCILVVMTFFSAIGNVAAASRQMWAFARDRGLPFGEWVAEVTPKERIPVRAIWVTFGITAALSLINLGSSVAFNALLSLGVVSLLSSYIISITCFLYQRQRNGLLDKSRWSLGRAGPLVNFVALAYLMVAFVFAFFPLANSVTPTTMNWSALIYGAVIIFSGVYYIFWAQRVYQSPRISAEKGS